MPAGPIKLTPLACVSSINVQMKTDDYTMIYFSKPCLPIDKEFQWLSVNPALLTMKS